MMPSPEKITDTNVHRLRVIAKTALFFFIALTLLCVALYEYMLSSLNFKSSTYPTLHEAILISHAGGGLDVGNYSNSKEAMDQSVAHGYKYIEVDISQTRNGDWVLIHDWNKSYFKYFIRLHQFPTYLFNRQHSIPKSADDFEKKNMRYNLTPMSLDSLIVWLSDNPDIKIVTDVRGSNSKFLEKIKSMMNGRTDQIIPQIYAPEEYQAIKALGYDTIILTVYNLDLNIETLKDLAEFSQANNLFALTVPQRWVNQGIHLWYAETDIRLFTHTINNSDTAEHLKSLGVSGFYTDYITPPQTITPRTINE